MKKTWSKYILWIAGVAVAAVLVKEIKRFLMWRDVS